MASDYARMARTPTSSGDADRLDENIGGDLKRKIENDAEAKIKALARATTETCEGRPHVSRGDSYTAEEAV